MKDSLSRSTYIEDAVGQHWWDPDSEKKPGSTGTEGKMKSI